MTYAVILAGGVGSRFWPFSRELEPKQFMKIIGEESLIQASIRRLKGIVVPERTYVITNNIYFYEVKAQVVKFGIPDRNIILEPEGKNTAPAAGLCARLISQIDKDAVLMILPSDHYIKVLPKFRSAIKKAILAAKEGQLVTIGIKPNAPSTGYGYVKVKSTKVEEKVKVKKSIRYFKVERFFEKPTLNKAKEYLRDEHYYWNSGMFVFKASVFLGEVKRYLPKLYANLEQINSVKDIPKAWPKIDAISIDYGIMERSQRIALIPSDFYWTDLGSWDALAGIFPKDRFNNTVNGDTFNLGSRGVCVFTKGNKLVSTIGVKDTIIVDTPDALLVCDRNKAQDVKYLVEKLKLLKRKEHQVHLTERRPWGSFTVLQQGFGFKIKLIEIAAHKRLSLQKHKKRAEHWVVVSGLAKVIRGTKVVMVRSNESIYIPKATKHRLENCTSQPVRIVEVQTGNYLEEDDIERFEDDYKKRARPGS